MYLMSLEGKLHLAPLGDKLENVLDMGTGKTQSIIHFRLVLIELRNRNMGN
jgi:hypothetical protein